MVVQHLLGLAMAVVIYVVLRRRGVWRWLAALATAPVLLDAYQLQIEHIIMSDTLFEACWSPRSRVLAWHRPPGPVAIAGRRVVLGAASTVRAVGVPLILVFLVYVLCPPSSGAGATALGVLLAALAFLVPAPAATRSTRSARPSSAPTTAVATRCTPGSPRSSTAPS